MKIEDVLAKATDDTGTMISLLQRQRSQPAVNIEKVLEEWDPAKHKIITDKIARPDKIVYDIKPADPMVEGSVEQKTSKIVPVARVAIAIQKLIVKRHVSFVFGNPVKIHSSETDDKRVIVDSINKILKDNKAHSHDRQVAKNMFACQEVAEYWYGINTADQFDSYGYPTKTKIRCKIFSPLLGDELFPFFESTGDMTAFSRQYQIEDSEGQKRKVFETWTDKKHYRWIQEGNGWALGLKDDAGLPVEFVEVPLGKIPVVYGCQEQVEWADVQNMIERLETVISNLADTNDYHASPKIVVHGEVKGFAQKGEAGGILEVEGDGSVEYLSWQQAPEAVKLEIDNLLRQIYAMTQTPDISFESVKGIGAAASGVSLKLLFLDAHLMVQDKMEIFDDFLPRRLSILMQFIKLLGKKQTANVDLTPEIIPYMVDDVKDEIDNLVAATGGGILSKKTAMKLNPLVIDAGEEEKLLRAEKEQSIKDTQAENAGPIPPGNAA